ncbi:MAG: NAD(P)/FAD-dependent oxidoreductase [Acidobacteria bacterium]|nr:NAD(P)/FAD-dependent oxidoreductase [Acidobacteriota bacterium]
MEKAKFESGVVIGAGVVGLAIAAELSACGLCRELWVIEKEEGFGRGSSARNSEVIHAGIYYPPESLKARLCIEGRERLYALCRRHEIPCSAIGKLIIAVESRDIEDLQHLQENARSCGVTLQELSLQEVARLEPSLRCSAALYSPLTGIIDSHALMRFFYREAVRNDTQFVFNTAVTAIEGRGDRYGIETVAASGEPFTLEAGLIINAAGLHSDEIAGLAGMDYRLHWCKGCYFSVSQDKAGLCSHLIYPAISKGFAGLGVHLTFDLSGRMKLGPDAEYIDRVEDYSVPEHRREAFCAAARYLPFLQPEDLSPEMAGIRSKLQGPGDPFADFVIRQDRPGFVNCVGIESPGLTSAPAIAAYVKGLLTAA